MSLIIAGERSGVGKTTITLALLAYLSRSHRRGSVQSFKVGPDYIDPMFHHYVTGRPCRNLDPVLTSENYVRQCFARHTQGMECAIVEGVMGLFDGVCGDFVIGDRNSAGDTPLKKATAYTQIEGSPLAPLKKGGTGVQVPLKNEGTGVQVPLKNEGTGVQVPLQTGGTGLKVPLEKGGSGVQVPLQTGETGLKVPLFKGDLGGSDRDFGSQSNISLKKGGDRGINRNDFASTAHVARLLNLPVLFVIDCSRLSGSVAAIAHGYRSWDPRIDFAGLVLNRVGSDRHLELLKDALEPLGLPILGILRRQDNITIPDRHLGLVPTDELPQLDRLLDKLAKIAADSFDWQQLLPLLIPNSENNLRPILYEAATNCLTRNDRRANSRSPLQSSSSYRNNLTNPGIDSRDTACPVPTESRLSEIGSTTTPSSKQINQNSRVKIGIARDAAFSFYYQDNLDILESLGAELIPWSPLTNSHFPAGLQGLYFGGGFPEMFAEQLSQNVQCRHAVLQAMRSGIPTYAECGGLMYLCQEIIDFEEKAWPMVGFLPSKTIMDRRLTLGYRRAIARENTPLLAANEFVFGHEFHRSRLTSEPVSGLFETWRLSPDAMPMKEGWSHNGNLHASYIHLHWGNRPEIAQRFLNHCTRNPVS